jgi:hypothetical protein
MTAQIITDLWQRRIERRAAEAAYRNRVQLAHWLARYEHARRSTFPPEDEPGPSPSRVGSGVAGVPLRLVIP